MGDVIYISLWKYKKWAKKKPKEQKIKEALIKQKYKDDKDDSI